MFTAARVPVTTPSLLAAQRSRSRRKDDSESANTLVRNEQWQSYHGRAEVIFNPGVYCRDINTEPGGDCRIGQSDNTLIRDIAHELGHVTGLADYFCGYPDSDHLDYLAPGTKTLMNSWTIVGTAEDDPRLSCNVASPAQLDKDDYRRLYNPAKVDGLAGSVDRDSVTLTWNQGDVFVESHFEIQWWDQINSTWVRVATAAANAEAATLRGQTPGVQRYRVVSRTRALPIVQIGPVPAPGPTSAEVAVTVHPFVAPRNVTLAVSDDDLTGRFLWLGTAPRELKWELHRSQFEDRGFSLTLTQTDSASPVAFADLDRGYWYKLRGRACETRQDPGGVGEGVSGDQAPQLVEICGDWSDFSDAVEVAALGFCEASSSGPVGRSGEAGTTATACIPAEPVITSQPTATTDSITITWSQVSGASGYKVHVIGADESLPALDEGSDPVPVSGQGSRSHRFPSLQSGTAYKVLVRAFNDAATSNWAERRVVTVLASPELDTPIRSETSITLRWGQVKNADSYDVARVATTATCENATVERNITEGLPPLAKRFEHRFLIPESDRGRQHRLCVRAVNDEAHSVWVPVVEWTTLPAPTGVTAADLTHDSATLTWNQVGHATLYQLKAVTADNCGGAETVTTIDQPDTGTPVSTPVKLPEPETDYRFCVRAVQTINPDTPNERSRESAWSSDTGTTKPQPDVAVTIDAKAIGGDGTVNIEEQAAVITITGTATANASVSVTVGGTTLTAVTADEDGDWTVMVPANSAYIKESSVSVIAIASKDGHEDATAEESFQVDLTAPTVSYSPPSSLQVDTALEEIDPTTTDTDIDSYTETGGDELPKGLSLDESTGVVSGTPKERGDGITTTVITVEDDAGNSSPVTLSLPRVEGLAQTLNGFKYAPATLNWGDDAPTLTPPTGAEGALTYSASPESVCRVNETSGALTPEGLGKCTITVTAAATKTHESKTDTAKVTINAPTLTGELRAVKRSNGQIEFAFRPTGGEDLLPSPNRFVLPSEMTPGKWTNSSSFTTTIDELEFTVGKISVRLNCAGYIEVTLLPGEGERISPTMRNFYYKTAVVDAWRRSASLTVTLTLPDEEEEAEGAIGTAGVRMQAAAAGFMYPPGVEGGLMAEAAAVAGTAVSTAPCTPENLEVTEIAQRSMTLSWDPAPGAASYEVMRTDATTPEASSGTTSHEFDELSAASEYRLSVRSKRGAQTSAWAHSTETTLACGNVPASARTRPVSELRWSGSGAIQDEQRRDGTQPQTRTVDWNDGTCTGTVGEWEDEGQPSWGQWSDTDRQRCNPVEPVKPLTTRTASVTVTLREWQVRGDTAYERVRTDTEHYSRSVTREPVSEGCGWVIELWGSPDRVEAGSARDSGTTKVRPAAEGRTVTLSTTYSWVVRGDVAHQQVTVRKRDDVRPYVWSSAPTNAWQAGSWQLGTPYTVGPTDTGSSLTRPEPEERTVTLSTTHSWDVRGSVAYQQVTVRKRDDLRPYVWSGAPTNAWQLGSWQEGTPYTEGPTDTGTTLTKPDDYTIGPISARDADQDVYRWVVVFGPNLTCREHQEVSEATKWTTYRVTYTWGGTSWDSVVTSSFYHTYGSYKRTGETRACNFGPSGSSATSDGFLLAAGDYELEWSSGRIAFSVPAGASVTLSWRELADGSSQAVFSLSDGGELVVAADALSSASGSGAPDNPTLAAIAASLRDPTTESAAATAASSTACATGAQSTDGVTQVDLDASACTIIGSGGSLKVTSGGVSRSFNLPTGQEWLIINASTGNGGDAAAMLVEIASGGRVTVDLAGGTELARSVPAGRPDLGALFDSLTTRPSEPGT